MEPARAAEANDIDDDDEVEVEVDEPMSAAPDVHATSMLSTNGDRSIARSA